MGHTFGSETDTEVLLASLERWGLEALKKITGMFAFALLDKENETLLLAGMALVLSPFFMEPKENVFNFGSTIPSVAASMGSEQEID